MGEFIGYMLFSLAEGLALYAIIFYILRIDLLKHIPAALIAISLINLQSYFIREELSLSMLSPFLNLIMTAIFLIAYLRVPLIWSFVMTIIGYVAFGLIQTVIVYFSFDYLSIQEVGNHFWKSYLLQAITGFIVIPLAYWFYRRGYGFTFELEKLRFRKERIFVTLAIVAFLISLLVMLFFKSAFSNLIVFGIALFLGLIYYQRKDSEEM